MPSRRFCSLLLVGAAALLLQAAQIGAARAQSVVRESFESPEASWRDAGGDAQYRLDQHQRSTANAHSGTSAEYVQLTATVGTRVMLAHDVARAAVIAELRPSVWIMADRPGLQLSVRVVLPRTLDPRTGKPVTAVIPGQSYTNTGRWQSLSTGNLPDDLVRTARVLRGQLGRDVDIREAYVDHVLLNIYGGPGVTRLWIDDLELNGFVEAAVADSPWPLASSVTAGGIAGGGISGGAVSSGAEAITAPRGVDPQRTVELIGSALRVEGRPFFPRIVRYQGEPLAYLRELGFNTIYCQQLPSMAMLQEAAHAGLRVICPPPLAGDDFSPLTSTELGPAFDAVLAWELGRELTGEHLTPLKKAGDSVRRIDYLPSRPLVAQIHSDVGSLGRYVDVLLAQKSTLAGTFELADYGAWLQEHLRLARPGTPLWAVVPTQADPAHTQQCALQSANQAPQVVATIDQLRLYSLSALSAGARGLLFDSSSRLDANDDATQRRAQALRLLNMELALVEPWGAAGRVVTKVDSSITGVSGVVLQIDGARLMLPVWTNSGAQMVPDQTATLNASFVIPGLPETSEAFEVTAGGLRILRRQRVAGGVRITLDEFATSAIVLITQDPSVHVNMARRLSATGVTAAQLQRDLAARQFEQTVEIDSRLAATRRVIAEAGGHLATAQDHLQRANRQIAAGDSAAAFVESRRAQRALNLVERAHWREAVRDLRWPGGLPLAGSFATLPEYWQLRETLAAVRWGPTRLPEGGFEDLFRMQQVGWRHLEQPPEGVALTAELSPIGPHSGNYALRLAAAREAKLENTLIEKPPVWVTSPEVMCEAGQWIRIRGWVNIPLPVSGSFDGLLVVDSIGGLPLAERIDSTNGWQEFAILRVAPQSGPVTVSLGLSGLGEVWIDDVSIEPLAPPAAEEVAPPGERVPAREMVPAEQVPIHRQASPSERVLPVRE